MRQTETGYPIEIEMLICYHVGKVNQAAKFNEDFKPVKKELVSFVLSSPENVAVFHLIEENIEEIVNYFWNWYEWP